MLADRWDGIHACIGKPCIPSKVEEKLHKEGPDEKRVGAAVAGPASFLFSSPAPCARATPTSGWKRSGAPSTRPPPSCALRSSDLCTSVETLAIYLSSFLVCFVPLP